MVVVARTEENRLLLQADALLELLQDAVAHQPALFALVQAVIQDRLAIRSPRGPDAAPANRRGF